MVSASNRVTVPGRVAFRALVEGNARFVLGELRHSRKTEEERQRQRQFIAVVRACGDSGVPPRRVFDLPVGDGGAFESRGAGGLYNLSAAEDMIMNVENGVRLIVTKGHVDCGAARLTCNCAYHGAFTAAGGITQNMLPAFRKTERTDDTGTEAHLSRAIRESAIRVARRVRMDDRIMSFSGPAGSDQEIVVVPAVYDLNTKWVEFLGKAARALQYEILTEMGIEWPFGATPGAETPALSSEGRG